eukprot:scpid79032/ scgid31058/ 
MTLHSDGTSKHGNKYGAYQIRAISTQRAYSLGMVDIQRGTASHTLEMLKAVLDDVSKMSAAEAEGKAGAGDHIIVNIKNRMSDRGIVQKTFNGLVEDYRKEVLPCVHSDWADLSEAQQKELSSMNLFFCGLHYIVGLADQEDYVLKEWEGTHFGETKVGAAQLPGVWEASHSSTNHLIYSATKAFEGHGDEAAGCIADFRALLRDAGIKAPLCEYRGNQNYVLFFNGAGVAILQELMQRFLSDVHGDTNRLLKAVQADLSVPELVAACRALDLICKLVISPLWVAGGQGQENMGYERYLHR